VIFTRRPHRRMVHPIVILCRRSERRTCSPQPKQVLRPLTAVGMTSSNFAAIRMTVSIVERPGLRSRPSRDH
jgi:hypothetical protein